MVTHMLQAHLRQQLPQLLVSFNFAAKRYVDMSQVADRTYPRAVFHTPRVTSSPQQQTTKQHQASLLNSVQYAGGLEVSQVSLKQKLGKQGYKRKSTWACDWHDNTLCLATAEACHSGNVTVCCLGLMPSLSTEQPTHLLRSNTFCKQCNACFDGARCLGTLSTLQSTVQLHTCVQQAEDFACCCCPPRYLPHSFVVSNVNVEGPILCLPDTWLMWDVKGFDDITPDSLALLDLVDPPPEVVVVGCGSKIRQLHPALSQHLRARGISVEALDTVSVW